MMEHLFGGQSSIEAVAAIFFIIALGLVLGRIKIKGISLGVTFVFFCGILAGHLGLTINPAMLDFAQGFGLILFVYALGLQVGPGFFNSFKKGGLSLNVLGFGVILVGTLLALLFSATFNVSLPDMVGILCGATTNTPALGAAQQTLGQFGLDSSTPALGCAVTYPLGVVGVILAMIFLKIFDNRSSSSDQIETNSDSTFIATYVVKNAQIFNHSIREVANLTHDKFVISRIWHNGKVSIPGPDSKLCDGDRILVVTQEKYEEELKNIFGLMEDTDWNHRKIDWNAIDRHRLMSSKIVVTKRSINGKSIASLKLRNRFGVNISRVFRSGVMLLATPDLVLRTGDRIIAVGSEHGIKAVTEELGNAVRDLKEPNLISICIGIVFGLVIGAIPIAIPGMSAPVRIGIAGGSIIAGILVGAYGPSIHMVAYTTESANLMLRKLGLSMYLACLGLTAGPKFFDTVFRPEGLLWIGLGFALTVIPVVIMGFISMKLCKLDFGTTCGMLCGAMANPMALTYATDNTPNNRPALSYSQVYPLCMFIRVIVAQVVLLIFLR